MRLERIASLRSRAPQRSVRDPAMGTNGSSLLLVLPLPLRYDPEGNLLIESQAANGLERWAENFDRFVAACVLTPDHVLRSRTSVVWRPVGELACADRVDVIPLPWAYRPTLYFRHFRETRRLLRELIQRSTYLVFGIGFLWGDWAALGCLEAVRMGRGYAVWTDQVDYQIIRSSAETKPLLRRFYGKHILSNATKFFHHHLIRKSRLGLFHGMDCYEAYAKKCTNPHVVHNIHMKRTDAISHDRLEAKAAEIESGCPLRIGYAGRADASKGAFDWIETIKSVVDAGLDVQATWLGDGPRLAEMKTAVEGMGLVPRVQLPGFVSDREAVLEFLKNTHVLMFCHKVPESPRVLVEALNCGTPIVGYDCPFARDLVSKHRWGILTSKNDRQALANMIRSLDAHRLDLAAMIRSTWSAPSIYNDVAVFRHRSDLIKEHLCAERRMRPQAEPRGHRTRGPSDQPPRRWMGRSSTR
jgi:glycosyltransferase involved in cell wall biosynthesis